MILQIICIMEVCVGFLMMADFAPELIRFCFTVDGGIMAH